MGIIIDGVSARDLVLDGQSVSLYEGGNPPVKVWPVGPRTATVLSNMGGFHKSSTGDADLVSGWPNIPAYGQAVSFAAPVTCNRTVRTANDQGYTFSVRAGNTIAAGASVIPGDYTNNVPFVFTEVL